MKKYNEIKQIITEHFKITSLEEYSKWLARWRSKEWIPTSEDKELLSPDVVDCHDFWKVVEDLFGDDCVCNAVEGNVYEDRMGANRNNLSIARTSGLIAAIDELKFYKANLLEVGAGYGSLKNYVETTTRFSYTGFDVLPKISGIRESTREGNLPEDFVKAHEGTFNIVASTNVFQHFSPKQKIKLIDDASVLLSDGGYLLINLPVDYSVPPQEPRYMTLYGQFIGMPSQIFMGDVLTSRQFQIFVTTIRHYDGMTGYSCIKRSPKKVSDAPAHEEVHKIG
jgi:hypothetical protein